MSKKNNVTRFLESEGVSYKAHTIPSKKLSAIEVSHYLQLPPQQVFKSIVLEGEKEKKGLLAVVPATCEVNPKKVAKNAGLKKVKVASLRAAETRTGLQAGGISPLALINKGFRIFLDKSAKNHSTIVISAGERGLQIEINPNVVIRLTGAGLGGLCYQTSGV